MREYNVHEVLAILQKYYITESQQMVARWIREGKIQGIRSENRKEGYRVSEEELFDFIEELRPGLPSIMEVYEEFIKKLRPEHSEETNQTHHPEVTPDIKKKSDSEENQYEKEINELREQIINLENTLIDLQQEKQIIEMNIIEMLEQNDKLIQDNKALVEEYKISTELYGIIDEEIRQLKISFDKPIKSPVSSKKTNKNTVNTTEEKTIHMTFEDFKEISKDEVLKLDLKLDNSKKEFHLITIYEQIFNDGQIKANLVATDGTIKCPYTKREFKQLKRIINSAIKYYFGNLNEHQQNQDQIETTMATE